MFTKIRSYKWVLLAPAAAFALAFAGCAGDDDDADSGAGGISVATIGGGSGDTSPTKPSGGGDAPASETITVVMTDNKFTPSTIKVPVGKKITFIAKNEGAAVHDMKILSKATEGKDFMSDALVNPETESKFTATFNKKGTVKFQCDYHLPDMVGTIEVE